MSTKGKLRDNLDLGVNYIRKKARELQSGNYEALELEEIEDKLSETTDPSLEKLLNTLGNDLDTWNSLINESTFGQYEIVSVSDNLFSSNKVVPFKCNMCNQKFIETPEDFIKGKRCPNCYGKVLKLNYADTSLKYSRVIDKLKELGYTLKSEFLGVQYDFMVEHEQCNKVMKVNILKMGGLRNIKCEHCKGSSDTNVSNIITMDSIKNELPIPPMKEEDNVVDEDNLKKIQQVEEIKKDKEIKAKEVKKEEVKAVPTLNISKEEEMLLDFIEDNDDLARLISRWKAVKDSNMKVKNIDISGQEFLLECNECEERTTVRENQLDKGIIKCSTCEINNEVLDDSRNLAIPLSIDSEVKIYEKHGNMLTLKRKNKVWKQTLDSILLNGLTY